MKEYINRHTVNLDMRFSEDTAIHHDLMNYRTICKGEFRTKEQYIKFCLRYAKENYFDKNTGGENAEVTLVDILEKISELENEWKKQNMLLLKKVEELSCGAIRKTETTEPVADEEMKEKLPKAADVNETTKEMEELAKMWG